MTEASRKWATQTGAVGRGRALSGCRTLHRVDHQVLTIPKLKPRLLPLSTEVPTCESPHPPSICSTSVQACSLGTELRSGTRGQKMGAGAVKSGVPQLGQLSGCLPFPFLPRPSSPSVAVLDGGLASLSSLLWLPHPPMNSPSRFPVKHWAIANYPSEGSISTSPSFQGIVGKCGGLNENNPQRLI